MRFSEYRRKQLNEQSNDLNEAGLSRVVDMMKKKDFAVVTAFRNPVTDDLANFLGRTPTLKEKQAVNDYNSSKIKGYTVGRETIENMPKGTKQLVDNKIAENRRQNKRILNFINSKSEQMGGYRLIGFWEEAPDDMDYEEARRNKLTVPTYEESIMITRPDNYSEEDFTALVELIRDEFNQDSVVIKMGDEVKLLNRDGSEYVIGNKFTVASIGQGYSAMRDKADVPFVFDFSEN